MEEQLQLVRGVSPLEVARFETLFKLFDEDGSGSISVKELADLMPRLGVFHTEEELQELFLATDQDGSGDVDFSEFLNLMASQREENQLNLLVNGRASISRLKVSLKLNNNRISPDGVFCSVLEMVTLSCLLLYCVIISFEWIVIDMEYGWKYRVIPSSIFVMDILLRLSVVALITGDNNDRLVQEQPELMTGYLKSKGFRYDILAALPLDIIFINFYYAKMVLQSFRLVKLFRVGDMFPIHGKELLTPSYAYMRFQVFPMVRLLFWAILTVHVLSVIWIGLDPEYGDYVDAIYFVMYTLSSTGYGDVTVRTAPQKLYCVALFCVATIVTGLIVGKLVKLSEQADLRSDTQTKMLETLAVMQHMCIPEDFAQEILAQQYHRLQNSFSIYSATIDNLPQAMRDRMLLYARMKVVCHVPMFSGSQEICLAKLAQALVSVVVPPDEYVIIAGEEGMEMYFLFHGTCDVIGETGTWLAFIKRGGVFGEIALLSATRRAASVKSLTYCQLFRLDKGSFDDISYQFPELRDAVAAVAQSRTKKKKYSCATAHTAQDCPPPNTGTAVSLRRSSRTAAKIAASRGAIKRDSKSALKGDAEDFNVKVTLVDGNGDLDNTETPEEMQPVPQAEIPGIVGLLRPTSPEYCVLNNGSRSSCRIPIDGGSDGSDDYVESMGTSSRLSCQTQYMQVQIPRVSDAFEAEKTETTLIPESTERERPSLNQALTARRSTKGGVVNKTKNRIEPEINQVRQINDHHREKDKEIEGTTFDKKIIHTIEETHNIVRLLSSRLLKMEHSIEDLLRKSGKSGKEGDTILTKTVLVRNKASTRNLLNGGEIGVPAPTTAGDQPGLVSSPRGERGATTPRGLRNSSSFTK